MDIDKKIEELRKEFNEKVDELKREYGIEKSEKWVPKENQFYFYVTSSMAIDDYNYRNDKIDESILKYNKIFKTEEEAQEYADYLKARKEYSYEFSKEEWEDEGIDKHSIDYSYEENDIEIETWTTYRNLNQIYFKTEAQAQAFIDKYKKQILKFEFEIEEE